MSNFSGSVKIQDLSDFIAPSQACVVKLDGSKKLELNADDVGEVSGDTCMAHIVGLAAKQQANVVCCSMLRRLA